VQVLPKPATTKNPPEQFTGDVWLDPIVVPQDADQRMVVALVRFAPGARTAWHSHARGQSLHVTSGVALVGTRDGVVEVPAGGTVSCPPGEEHWHGAAADTFMSHFALLENNPDGSDPTTWLEPVTDEQYAAAQATQHH
jgi:quercetin dioxygenase-like cupin family protein